MARFPLKKSAGIQMMDDTGEGCAAQCLHGERAADHTTRVNSIWNEHELFQYVLTMMSLVDSNAPEDLIISVRDKLRHQLIGQHYCDRKSICDQYKNEKYSWVETTKEE